MFGGLRVTRESAGGGGPFWAGEAVVGLRPKDKDVGNLGFVGGHLLGVFEDGGRGFGVEAAKVVIVDIGFQFGY